VHKRIAAQGTAERMAAFPPLDGVVAFAQTSGCGMSSPSEHFDVLRRTLAGYARHPTWPACSSWAWAASATRSMPWSIRRA
jgi:altronate dehydratase